jgi:hypothetical protein
MFDAQIRSIGSVADDIERSGDREGAEYLRNHLDEDIKQCMVDVLKVSSIALIPCAALSAIQRHITL